MRIWRHDESGAVFAEFALLLPLIVLVVCGSIDFLNAFYQWNAAAKAVEVGARIAAVSDPVAPNLNNVSNQALLNGSIPGSPLPSFMVVCKYGACSCTGTCTGLAPNGFDSVAMDRIIFGRGSHVCGDATSYYAAGCATCCRPSPRKMWSLRIVKRALAMPADRAVCFRP